MKKPMPTNRSFKASVKKCARCQEDHMRPIYFAHFTHAPKGFTHWGICPVTEEPILMEVRDMDGDNKG